MKSFTNQQKFMAVIFAIYIPTHLLAFYVYYNPPKDAWFWVDAITTALPQLGGLMEFKKMPLIGTRLAFMFAVTYVPFSVVGLLMAHHSTIYGKRTTLNPKTSIYFLALGYFAFVVLLVHYMLYWTSYGKGYLVNFLHPSTFAPTPIVSSFCSYYFVLVIHKFFQSKQK